jgi:diadenylate cyclase
MIDFISLWKPIVEILILWFMIYHIMRFLEGTRAIQVLLGITVLLVAFLVFQRLNFTVLDWLLTKLFGISVIAILVLFNPEIRQGLARLGRRQLFSTNMREEEIDQILTPIIKAAESLSKEKAGALIAIEKSDLLTPYTETGVSIDARISADLIETVFTPRSLLHDGGMIIQRGRISAAGVLFPLSQNQDLSRIFGTRHRAALGLSEETDAIIIVVSEERQDISLVYRGNLYKDLDRGDLHSRIKALFKLSKEDTSPQS